MTVATQHLIARVRASWIALPVRDLAEILRPLPLLEAPHDTLGGLVRGVAIVRGLWSGTPFTFEGEHLRVADAAVTPPPQPGGVPLVIAGGGPRTLAQVARLADACNFGPGPAGNVDTPRAAADRFATLRAACRETGRPYDAILRSHFTHWLIVAPTAADVRRKVDRYFPDGLDAFWGAYLVAGTPDEVAARYQAFADVGVQYFIVQTLDPTDEESIALAAQSLGALVPGPN